MTFAGSFSAALKFALTGAPSLGSESKGIDFVAAATIGNGTSAGQASLGWGTLVVIPAGQTYVVDLQAAPGSVLGVPGAFAFTNARGVYVENQETNAANQVLVGIAGNTDVTGYAVALEGGGVFLWTAPNAGRPITSANRYLNVSNPGAASVAVAIGVIGLGSILDA